MTTYVFTIHRKNGLHVRIGAAFIAKLQELLGSREALKSVYVEFKDKRVQVNNLIALVSLRIGQGDCFAIHFDSTQDPSKDLIQQLHEFFEKAELEDQKEAETDRLLMESSIITQEALSHLPNGMIVVNRENIITFINDAAAALLGRSVQELLNERADEVIPHSKLKLVLAEGITQFAEKQQLKHHTILTNRAPIFYNQKIIGAVAIFQDISPIEEISRELQKEKELQEKLNLVLESVSDCIALTDENGCFTYMNEHMQSLMTSIQKPHHLQSIMSESEWKLIQLKKLPIVNLLQLSKKQSYISKMKPVLIDHQFTGVVLTLTAYHEVKELHKKIDMMEQRTKYLEQELSKHLKLDEAFQTIIGSSETLLESLSLANKVSKTNSTVLITGESGTGKELVARAVHLTSHRKDQSFIRVNCAAIPPNLIESELFGHEKGAFTGAYRVHRGKFELAHHGTIFLDEIGDLSLDLQAKLLRVLQEREIERIGGTKTISLDVRVVAATHQDLRVMVENGTFREDLYYRLHVIPVHLPPLRSRMEDIPLLVNHFRERFSLELGKSINSYEPGFFEALGRYHWPGNIRELQNIIEQLCAITDDDILHLNDLPSYILGSQKHRTFQFGLTGEILPLEEYEKQIYTQAAPLFPSYNQLGQALGVTHKTVASKLKKYGLEELLGKKYQPVDKIYP
jgi:TyrR family helix-turn-helix protein/PAS domain S-box-containing protein